MLFCVPVFPADLADPLPTDDAACYLLDPYGWGF